MKQKLKWLAEHSRMAMHVITMNGKPATMERLYANEKRSDVSSRLDETERLTFITATTNKGCRDRYLHFFGFTWAERPKNIDVALVR